jgi:hypothetical protein
MYKNWRAARKAKQTARNCSSSAIYRSYLCSMLLSVLTVVSFFQVELSKTAVQQMVSSLCLNGADSVHSSNPKFGKLLLSAVNIYGGEARIHRITMAFINYSALKLKRIVKICKECFADLYLF